MSDINVVLAERSGTGAVRLCGCDCIHMSIGPVTINMAPEVFAQAALLMKQAMDCLTDMSMSGDLDPLGFPVPVSRMKN